MTCRSADVGRKGAARGLRLYLEHDFFGLTKKLVIFAPPKKNGESVAQLVEHNTFNVGVPGSSPGWFTETLDRNGQ